MSTVLRVYAEGNLEGTVTFPLNGEGGGEVEVNFAL